MDKYLTTNIVKSPLVVMKMNYEANSMIENVLHNEKLIAIIVRKDFREPGIHFFTPDDFTQQLAYMRHPTGKTIIPHRHNTVLREIYYTQEVLFILKGVLKVDFYDEQEIYLRSTTLQGGDVILLASGGHGFEVIEEVEMFEVKQGPHVGEADKTRFPRVL